MIPAELVDRFHRGFTTGVLDLPTGAGPHDLDTAQAVQVAVLDRLEAAGRPAAGWKVGFTSREARDRAGPGVRPFGFVLAERLLASGSTIARDGLRIAMIEPELCFTIGRDLGAGATRSDLAAAVTAVAPAFEVNEVRWEEGTPVEAMVADDLAQWGVVVGDSRPSLDGLDDVAVTVRAGDRVVVDAVRPEIDDHLDSLVALVGRLERFGRRLEAGHRVITGSYADLAVTSPGTWSAHFEGLGDVAVTFT